MTFVPRLDGVHHLKLPVRKQREDAGLSVLVKLLPQQLGFQHQVSQCSSDAKNLGEHREQIPTGRTCQVSVHSAPSGADVLGYAGIHTADAEILGVLVNSIQHFVAFVH